MGVVQDRFIFEEVYAVSLKKHTHTHTSCQNQRIIRYTRNLKSFVCGAPVGSDRIHRTRIVRTIFDSIAIPKLCPRRLDFIRRCRLPTTVRFEHRGTYVHRSRLSTDRRFSVRAHSPTRSEEGAESDETNQERRKKKSCGKIWILVCTSKVVVTQWDHVAVIQGISPSRSPTAWPGRSPVFIATKCTVALASSIETASPRKSVSSRSL